jgi:large subunit ribosomal protein L21
MYALVEIKGKQYKAEKGSKLTVDLLDQEKGSKVEFDSVLLTSDKEVKVGTPYVKDAKVSATVEDHFKDKKVTVLKFKRRKSYRRKQGHRQQYTVIKVNDIKGA